MFKMDQKWLKKLKPSGGKIPDNLSEKFFWDQPLSILHSAVFI
jgi:hypothetical protein